MKPRARKEKLLIQEVQGELVIYDEERDHAHHLNRTAALVWRHSDGQKSVREIAALLQQELNPAADEDLVWTSLEDLGAAQLLQEAVDQSAEQMQLSRRRVVQQMGVAGALSLLLPVVTSMVAPTPAEAASGGEEEEEEEEED